MWRFNLTILVVVALGCAALIFKFSGGTQAGASAVGVAIQLNEETLWAIVFSFMATGALIVTVRYSALAAEAASKASDTASKAIEHAKDVSARELRPYMVPKFEVVRAVDKNDKAAAYQFNLLWQNIGKTPATRCSYAVCSFGSTEGIGDNYSFSSATNVHSVGVIMQNEFQRMVAKSAFSTEEMHRVFTGEVVFIYYAWIDYSDLGNQHRFRTEYACRVTCQADPLTADDADFRPSPLIRFNGMDEDCLRAPQPYAPHQEPLAPARV